MPEIGRISCHVHNAHLAPTIGFNKRKMEDQRRHLAGRDLAAPIVGENSIGINGAAGRAAHP